ncbi:unnamed protein product [Orchesella dallaii]|uniref:Uncharacterized protein n=1 Tax=Orchesella dallaii TaxID=48710 RepID=A0ABP1RFB2_9HEXA
MGASNNILFLHVLHFIQPTSPSRYVAYDMVSGEPSQCKYRIHLNERKSLPNQENEFTLTILDTPIACGFTGKLSMELEHRQKRNFRGSSQICVAENPVRL